MRISIVLGFLLAAAPAFAQTPATGPSAVSPVGPGGAQSPATLGQPPAAAPANSPTVPERVSPDPVGPLGHRALRNCAQRAAGQHGAMKGGLLRRL